MKVIQVRILDAFYKIATSSKKVKLKQHRAHYVHQTTLQEPPPPRRGLWAGRGTGVSFLSVGNVKSVHCPKVQVSAEVVFEGGATERTGEHFAALCVVSADVAGQ